MHLIRLGRATQYLVDCVQLVNTRSIRRLRSSDTTDYLKHATKTKFSELLWTSGMELPSTTSSYNY